MWTSGRDDQSNLIGNGSDEIGVISTCGYLEEKETGEKHSKGCWGEDKGIALRKVCKEKEIVLEGELSMVWVRHWVRGHQSKTIVRRDIDNGISRNAPET